MLSTIWSTIKLLRYLLPFLVEVQDEKGIKTPDDVSKVKRLRRRIFYILWRIILFVILSVVIFRYAIPLYVENAVLRQELSEREATITQLEMRRNEAVKAQYQAMGNTQECNIKLTAATEEIKYLIRKLSDLQEEVAKHNLHPELLSSPIDTHLNNNAIKQKSSPVKTQVKEMPKSLAIQTRVKPVQKTNLNVRPAEKVVGIGNNNKVKVPPLPPPKSKVIKPTNTISDTINQRIDKLN